MPRSSVLAILLEQHRDWGAEGVRHLNERSNGGISIAPLQVRQIAPLHRRALGKLLLRPVLCASQRLDPLRKEFQDLGFRYRQPFMVSEVVTDCCTIGVTIRPAVK